MTIDNFSAIIELAATMSIAFVAVEYVTSYTSVLCEKFFSISCFISTLFGECRAILTDTKTLEHLKPSNVDGKSTNSAIEKLKRLNELLNKEINEKEKQVKSNMTLSCQVISMSSLCLFLFMFNTLLLLFSCIESSIQDYTYVFISLLSLLSILYLLGGWILGEYSWDLHLLKFSSLKHAVIGFIVIMVLSFLGSCFVCNQPWKSKYIDIVKDAWIWILMLDVLLAYFNFIVFMFKIWRKGAEFKEDIKKTVDELKIKCTERKGEEDDFIAMSNVIARLSEE